MKGMALWRVKHYEQPEAVLKEGESEDWDTTVTKPYAGPQMRSTKHFGQNATKPSIWFLSKLHMIT